MNRSGFHEISVLEALFCRVRTISCLSSFPGCFLTSALLVMLIWPALSVFESPFTGGLPALSTHLHPPFSDIRDGDFCTNSCVIRN